MYDKTVISNAARRITAVRMDLVHRFPFFGKLLLRLKVRFGEVGTACTDMDSITFDPDFMQRLDDAQLAFVMLHEVLHCAFKHCIRGKGKIPLVYNIACDIVVNSFILETLGITDFMICGEEVMHLTPDGAEGRSTTAEHIYDMLIRQNNLQQLDEQYRKGAFDRHDNWKKIDERSRSEIWGKYIRDAAVAVGVKGCGNIPGNLGRLLKEIAHHPKTNWRQLLQDYIRFDRYDYSFTSPDRRFQDDVLLPSFQQSELGDSVGGIWLFVDTSGSISDEQLAVLMKEIYSAYEQIENISGRISFFDTEITPPVTFESYEELKTAKPVGSGGTSFINIFRYLHTLDEDELPDLILIFTDGYAAFPDEDAAMDIPVIWLIEDSDVEPPWGSVIYIDSDE